MSELKIEPPDNFPFPFMPYDIQKEFMRNLYIAIEGRKIGIFESPTGTGKSLSLICGSLKWLHDHEKRLEESRSQCLVQNSATTSNSQVPAVENGEPSWIQEFVEKQSVQQELMKQKAQREQQQKRFQTLKNLMKGESCDDRPSHRTNIYKKRHQNHQDESLLMLMKQAENELEMSSPDLMADPDDLLIAPEEYKSDDEAEDKVSEYGKVNEEDDGDEFDDLTKIYFCSRTHSQLSQFVHELQKSPYAKPGSNKNSGIDEEFQITVTTLASRGSLCINNAVKSLKSLNLINERCLDMQKNSNTSKQDTERPAKKRRKEASSCPYFTNTSGKSVLTGKILSQVLDIEEISSMAKENQACPYYVTRNAAKYSQLIVLPYQTILHRETRNASKIRLKDSVVIVDEAHNLIEAINAMHSCQVSLSQLTAAFGQLTRYSQRFSKQLAARNLFYVKQLKYVLKRLISWLEGTAQSKENEGPDAGRQPHTDKVEVEQIHHFLFQTQLDNVNWFKLLRYCERSKISRKLLGFVEKYDQEKGAGADSAQSALSAFLQQSKRSAACQGAESTESPPSGGGGDVGASRCPLQQVETFMRSLATSSDDGRIVVTRIGSRDRGSSSLKFLLLNPADHFNDVLMECRSVIVAGGTMQPSASLIDQLFAGCRQRVVEFSCGHVIDGASQLLPATLTTTPSGADFHFTFARQTDAGQLDQLGRTVVNMCHVIPGGVVCFFPSYKFADSVHRRWQQTGLLASIEKKKKVFCEPKQASQVDRVLIRYKNCIDECKTASQSSRDKNGAVLLCVVGGKMSEGINFSDDLGRCVIMVGLPYPNVQSPELKEKMDYLDRNLPHVKDGPKPGQVYYEELCMKAVNQSIGRAIRHRNDYACILLLDKRYSRPNVVNKLPKWISAHMKTFNQFGPCFAAVKQFFAHKAKDDIG